VIKLSNVLSGSRVGNEIERASSYLMKFCRGLGQMVKEMKSWKNKAY